MELFSETFIEKIGYLDFQILDSEQSPVIFVSELKNPVSQISPHQIIALEEAKSFKADAVFFRYFEDNRSPQAQIYIYDNSNGSFDDEYAEIHKQLWSSCRIPVFIIVEEFKIRIFDCRKPVSVSKEGDVYTNDVAHVDIRNLEKFSDVIQKYNAQKFSNGTFWESSEAISHFTYGETAYKELIEGLKNLRSNYSINETNKISEELSDYIIIISILVKYLEENGIDEQGNNLAADFFDIHVGCRSFIEILEKNKLVEILECLSSKFNGGIFSLSNNQKQELQRANLSPIATFFDARTTYSRQLVFWPMYSFKHIPVELISNIYEEFIPKHDKGAVYTPHYLVNLLIDECLPLPNKINSGISTENVKLIDISCGSGIFLVNAFKRLVQIYKVKQYHKTGSFSNIIPINVLQQIIRDNIFGVDINPHAVNLTKFSLCLAICQTLSPQQIWTELSFEDLGIANIVREDFFQFIADSANHKKYDLIIGNPPFNTPTDPVTGKAYKKAEFINLIKTTYKIDSPTIGDNDLALFFLQQSLKLLKESALLCLIQKSIPLLHTKENESFRKDLFKTFSIPQVIDFTPYRRILFHNVTVPTCAIFIENSPPVKDYISHIVIKRTKPGKEKLFFEIDPYDMHNVLLSEAHLNYSWKCNIFGGYRLLELVKKLGFKPKVSQLIRGQKSKKGTWSDSDVKKFEKNGLFLPTKITRGVFPQPLASGENTNRSTWGVVGNSEIVNQLKDYFNSNGPVLSAYIAGTSSRQGLDRTYDLYTEDITGLPFLEKKDIDKLTIADWIVIKDIVNYRIIEFGDPDNSITNKEVPHIGTEIPHELILYSDCYTSALNSVFNNTKSFCLSNVIITNSAFLLEFSYTELPTNLFKFQLALVESDLDSFTQMSPEEKSSILVRRISHIYTKERVTLIKPKQLRFWLQSVALIDADSTVADIVNFQMASAND